MLDKNDWRLLNAVDYLKKASLNPIDGEEILQHSLNLKYCIFCLEPIQDTPYQKWFIPLDLSCCICEECFDDLKEEFQWRELDGWDIDFKE